MTIQVRASHLDEYAYMTEYRDRLGSDAAATIDEQMTPADWLKRFTGEREETEPMLVGTSSHHLLDCYPRPGQRDS